MEVSIGGSGYRATINAYMYGDALAIARIAERFGRKRRRRAVPRQGGGDPAVDAGEALGPRGAVLQGVAPRAKTPSSATPANCTAIRRGTSTCPTRTSRSPGSNAMDPQGFYAPFGLTTAEQRHPKFAISYQGHECQWNGPSWPFSTAITLTAMANLLNNYQQDVVRRERLLRPAEDLHQVAALETCRRPRRALDRREPQPGHGRLDLADAC